MKLPVGLTAAALTPFLVLALYPFVPQGTVRFALLLLALVVAPGHAVTTWLTARTDADLTPLERIALTTGTGIAVAALAVTVANVTAWGVRAPAVFVIVGVATLAAAGSALARGVGASSAPSRARVLAHDAWAPRSSVLALVVVLALAGGVLLALPNPGGSSQMPFTSFYVTLEDGRVGPFPDALREGERLVVVVHVESHEPEDARDRLIVVDAHANGTRTLVDEVLPVPSGARVTRTVELATDARGAHRFTFTLERDGEAYRHLTLPVRVT